MANAVYLFGKGHANLLGGETAGEAFAIDYLSDTIKCALLAASYTPNRNTHETFDDVDGDELTGTGYTAGGATLASKTITYTAANAWATAWVADTVTAVGDIVRPTTGNGHLFRAIAVAGDFKTHATVEPTWPTVSGMTVVDDQVTWAEIGSGVTQLDAANPAWGPPATIAGIRYGVVYKSTGTPNTSPLIALVDFADGPYSVSGAGGTFTAEIHALGIYVFSTP